MTLEAIIKRRFICSLLFTFGICVLSCLALANLLTAMTNGVAAAPRQLTQGALEITDQEGRPAGQCPLKHTAVKTAISGGLARTVVTQEFHNPLSEKIEAVYVFPLSQNAAVDDLMSQDYAGLQNGNAREEVREAITQLGLEYRLMTQFTSFVAVEEMIVTEGGQPRRIDVPVEMPERVNRSAIFGETIEIDKQAKVNSRARMLAGEHRSGFAGTFYEVSSRAPASPPPQAIVAPTPIAIDASKTKASGGVLQDTAARREQIGKLHPSVTAVIARLQNRQAPASKDEAKFVRDGKAELQIWLADKTAATLKELKKIGFEIVLNPSSAKLVIGRLPLEKLAALAALTAVRYVAPQSS